MLGGSSLLGSVHEDVLSANPENEESAVALVEEIKTRARPLFASGNFQEAAILYDKAIAVRPDAILYANRSAVRLNQGHPESALEDANHAVELDVQYSKAHYRKGQAHAALGDHAAAYAAFQQGLELEPDNKIFKNLAAKALEQMKASSPPEPMEVEEPPSSSIGGGASPAPSPTKANGSDTSPDKSGAGKKTRPVTKKEESEDDLAAATESLRGYKVLADGRKTTYFNNELSEEAKKLIGDIAPKKIDAVLDPSLESRGAKVGSAWNYAGTFEERNMTSWAKEKLRALLSDMTFVIPSSGSVLEVKAVKDLEGDAAITFTRGKKKYLFDFAFVLDWEVELDCGPAKGTLRYPDVTPDADGDYDTILEVSSLTPPAARGLVDKYVKGSSDGLQTVVAERLKQFMAEFKTF